MIFLPYLYYRLYVRVDVRVNGIRGVGVGVGVGVSVDCGREYERWLWAWGVVVAVVPLCPSMTLLWLSGRDNFLMEHRPGITPIILYWIIHFGFLSFRLSLFLFFLSLFYPSFLSLSLFYFIFYLLLSCFRSFVLIFLLI